MTISPIQNNYVTKSEFNEFRVDTANNFRIIREDIKDIKNQFSELKATISEDNRKTNEKFRATISEDNRKTNEKFRAAILDDVRKTNEEFRTTIREDVRKTNEEFRTTIREDVRKTNEEFRASIREDFKNQTGILIETFQHNLKASMEYMDSKLNKKLDRDEFYEYMDLHFPKIKKQIKIK